MLPCFMKWIIPFGILMLQGWFSRFAVSQWETALLCNVISHWSGANLESALMLIRKWNEMLGFRPLLYLVKLNWARHSLDNEMNVWNILQSWPGAQLNQQPYRWQSQMLPQDQVLSRSLQIQGRNFLLGINFLDSFHIFNYQNINWQ